MKTVDFGANRVQLYSFHKSADEIARERISHLELKYGDCENAFFLADLADVVRKYERWTTLLPRVEPFYAVKCNGDPAVLRLLAELGIGFDCASKAEMASVLKLSVRPSRIVFANPCKLFSHIRYAAKGNVDLMTFDNESELYKIRATFPTARILLRILPPGDYKVQCQLGNKFGCHLDNVDALLTKARELDLTVVGVSFHVGSGVADAEAFPTAVASASSVFDIGLHLGFDFNILDIGGGFPGHAGAPISFEKIAGALNVALDRYFPSKRNVRIIAEPGRFFVASAFSLTVTVIGKRAVVDRPGNSIPDEKSTDSFMYYVNDGLYGSFNCLLYDHAEVVFKLLNPPVNQIRFLTSIWGPTCDGLDQIMKNVRLPELDVGDHITFPDMGAYTMSASSGFNGMPRPDVIYCCSEGMWGKVFAPRNKPETRGELKSESSVQLPIMKTGHQLEDADMSSVSPRTPAPIAVTFEDDECVN